MWRLLLLILITLIKCAHSDDSYLSAFKLTHQLNDHYDNQPTRDKVVYVNAQNQQNIDVHPVYVHGPSGSSQSDPQVAQTQDSQFHVFDHDLSHHTDHANVEHHYQPEYHQHYLDLSQEPSGLGSYGTGSQAVSSYEPPAAGVPTYGPPAPINVPRNVPKKLPPAYGPPAPVYHHSQPTYHPPSHTSGVYGSPHHKLPPLVAHEYYGPNPPSILPEFVQNLITPHAFLGILDHIKSFKLDLFTIGKIILKFFIFKKFLTFFTILFLLLVIPSLKHKGKESVNMMTDMIHKFGTEGDDGDDKDEEEDDDESRSMRKTGKMFIDKTTDSINLITSHVLEAIEKFEKTSQKVDVFSKDTTLVSGNGKTQPSTILATDLGKLSPSEKTDCLVNMSSIYCKSQSVIEKIKAIMPSLENSETTTTIPKKTIESTTIGDINSVKNSKANINLTSKSQLQPQITQTKKLLQRLR